MSKCKGCQHYEPVDDSASGLCYRSPAHPFFIPNGELPLCQWAQEDEAVGVQGILPFEEPL